jgi:SAM-dependent methyltransferase
MRAGLKPALLARLACPKCGQALLTVSVDRLVCEHCSASVPLICGKPLFTPVPPGMQAAPKLVRGPECGSTWRQANWRFLEKVVNTLPSRAVILDFGAGHGDFAQVLQQREVIALDVFPYDEVDLVCDLQTVNPFKPSSFDAIVLMNVLEHVQQPEKLLKTLAGLLRPGGSIIVTVPFMMKLHQLPYDFYRYSHLQLGNIGHEAGLEITAIEGYYDPVLLLNESMLNVRSFALPEKAFLTRKLSRVIIAIGMWFLSGLNHLIGKGHVGDPRTEKIPYPIGYHVVYRASKRKKKQS